MKPRVKVVALLVALAVVLCSTAATAAKPSTPAQSNGRYLVVFKAGTLPSDATQRVVNSGGNVVRAFQQIGVVSAIGDAAFAKTIAKDAKVLSVGPEHMFAAPDVQAVELTDDIAVPESAAGPVSGVDTSGLIAAANSMAASCGFFWAVSEYSLIPRTPLRK